MINVFYHWIRENILQNSSVYFKSNCPALQDALCDHDKIREANVNPIRNVNPTQAPGGPVHP